MMNIYWFELFLTVMQGDIGHTWGGGDEARNYQGCIGGVSKRFENENNLAILVHCFAHSVNCYLQDIASV